MAKLEALTSRARRSQSEEQKTISLPIAIGTADQSLGLYVTGW